MLQTLTMGTDFDPKPDILDQSFILFSLWYHFQKVLMLILGFLIVHRRRGTKVIIASLLGMSLIMYEMVFFTNYSTQTGGSDAVMSMIKLFLK